MTGSLQIFLHWRLVVKDWPLSILTVDTSVTHNTRVKLEKRHMESEDCVNAKQSGSILTLSYVGRAGNGCMAYCSYLQLNWALSVGISDRRGVIESFMKVSLAIRDSPRDDLTVNAVNVDDPGECPCRSPDNLYAKMISVEARRLYSIPYVFGCRNLQTRGVVSNENLPDGCIDWFLDSQSTTHWRLVLISNWVKDCVWACF